MAVAHERIRKLEEAIEMAQKLFVALVASLLLVGSGVAYGLRPIDVVAEDSEFNLKEIELVVNEPVIFRITGVRDTDWQYLWPPRLFHWPTIRTNHINLVGNALWYNKQTGEAFTELEWTPRVAGTYTLACELHAGMRILITVK